jgi:hypothetical protein
MALAGADISRGTPKQDAIVLATEAAMMAPGTVDSG